MSHVISLARPSLLWLSAAALSAWLLAGCGRGDRDFAGWRSPVRLDDGQVHLVAVPQVARILDFGPTGGTSLLWCNPELAGKTADLDLGNQAFGGAKLWVAPQSAWKSIWIWWPPCPFLDAGPCALVSHDATTFSMSGHEGSRHGVRFDRAVRLVGPSARIDYTMTAVAGHAVDWSIWSNIQCRRGGRMVIPLGDDGRVHWNRATEQQHWQQTYGGWEARQAEVRGKALIDGGPGWIAYAVDDEAFVLAAPDAEGPTPHGDSRFEIFSNDDGVEMEHLGPYVHLDAGAATHMREIWYAFRLPPGLANGPIPALTTWITQAMDHTR
jgi:hypothetical protein